MLRSPLGFPPGLRLFQENSSGFGARKSPFGNDMRHRLVQENENIIFIVLNVSDPAPLVYTFIHRRTLNDTFIRQCDRMLAQQHKKLQLIMP